MRGGMRTQFGMYGYNNPYFCYGAVVLDTTDEDLPVLTDDRVC